jgi:hypothetical protein
MSLPAPIPRSALLLVAVLLASCGGSGTSSPTPAADVDATAAAEVAPEPDLQTADPGPPPEPLYESAFEPFADLPPEGPAIFLTRTEVNGPNLVTFFVRARGLGNIAGLAFYLEYDPELLRLEGGQNHLSLGNSGPYFTVHVLKELEPGLVTFGVARFCKDKLPWGSVDQCGGSDVNDEEPVMSVTFQLQEEGQAALRFPKAHVRLVRPDRSLVPAAWIGGTLSVRKEEVQ